MDLLAAGGDRDPALLGIVEAIFARLESPLAPRRNDFQFRRESLEGMLEADLIIAFAGASVSDGGRALAQRNLDLMLCNYRPDKRTPKQRFLFVGLPSTDSGVHI